MILDHYVVNKQNCQFVYAAVKETHGFCLKRKFLHSFIFEKYPDFYTNVSMSSYSYYKMWIYKPIRDVRRKEIQANNKTRFLFNQINLEERFGDGTKYIPTRD